MRQPSSSRSIFGSANSFWPRVRSRSMRSWRRCSILAAAAKKGYFWAIARDDRPWSGTDPPAVTYSYAPGRGAVHALKLLEHYRGIVQCDGYAAYKSIADAAGGEAITLAFCWAHLRRRFFDIAKDGSAPIASEALERIAALYAIEKTIRGHSVCARRATRQEKSQEKSKPLVLALTLPATIRGRRTGPALLRSSKPANCTASIRKPTSPTCSPGSSISGPPRVSTNSCPGPGAPSAPPNSRRDKPNRAAVPAKKSSRQSHVIRGPLTQDRRGGASHRFRRGCDCRLGALLGRRLRGEAAYHLRLRRRAPDRRRHHARPPQQHHRRPGFADCSGATYVILTLAITTLQSGPVSTTPVCRIIRQKQFSILWRRR